LGKDKGWGKVGFEAQSLIFSQYQKLQKGLSFPEWVPCEKAVEELRIVKDMEEIRRIQGAVAIVIEALEAIKPLLRPGAIEREVSVEFEYRLKQAGSEKIPFDLIVASGTRSALPHGVASSKEIAWGDLVTIDCGAVFQGYHSDLTRTFVVGEYDSRQEDIYRIVLEAQQIGIEAIRPGKRTHEVDAAVRGVIEDAGYGDFFGHGTGHGIGLAMHENPYLSKDEGPPLEKGMVVTVEPGIYLPDWGGVRIEDMVCVTSNGGEVLTASLPRILEVL
jgi:Xaa-Pro aminopeptidase